MLCHNSIIYANNLFVISLKNNPVMITLLQFIVNGCRCVKCGQLTKLSIWRLWSHPSEWTSRRSYDCSRQVAKQTTNVYCIRTPDRVQTVPIGSTHTQSEEMSCQPLQALLHLAIQTSNVFIALTILHNTHYFLLINEHDTILNKRVKMFGRTGMLLGTWCYQLLQQWCLHWIRSTFKLTKSAQRKCPVTSQKHHLNNTQH